MKISWSASFAVLIVNVLLFSVVAAYFVRTKSTEDTISSLQLSQDENAPTHILIPRLGIDKQVKPGVYDLSRDSWLITQDAAHFAVISTSPNMKQGTTVIYAHNSPTLFGKIHTLSSGDMVTITSKEGRQFTYSYKSQEKVLPTNVSVFHRDGAPQLTLITCSGPKNSQRLLVHLQLVTTN